MVADHRSADPAETFLGGITLAEFGERSRVDDGSRHRRVQASAIDPTSL
jgi:hypothetical protein